MSACGAACARPRRPLALRPPLASRARAAQPAERPAGRGGQLRTCSPSSISATRIAALARVQVRGPGRDVVPADACRADRRPHAARRGGSALGLRRCTPDPADGPRIFIRGRASPSAVVAVKPTPAAVFTDPVVLPHVTPTFDDTSPPPPIASPPPLLPSPILAPKAVSVPDIMEDVPESPVLAAESTSGPASDTSSTSRAMLLPAAARRPSMPTVGVVQPTRVHLAWDHTDDVLLRALVHLKCVIHVGLRLFLFFEHNQPALTVRWGCSVCRRQRWRALALSSFSFYQPNTRSTCLPIATVFVRCLLACAAS